MAWHDGKVAPRPPSRINFLAVVSDRLLSAATCLMMSKEEAVMMIVADGNPKIYVLQANNPCRPC